MPGITPFKLTESLPSKWNAPSLWKREQVRMLVNDKNEIEIQIVARNVFMHYIDLALKKDWGTNVISYGSKIVLNPSLHIPQQTLSKITTKEWIKKTVQSILDQEEVEPPQQTLKNVIDKISKKAQETLMPKIQRVVKYEPETETPPSTSPASPEDEYPAPWQHPLQNSRVPVKIKETKAQEQAQTTKEKVKSSVDDTATSPAVSSSPPAAEQKRGSPSVEKTTKRKKNKVQQPSQQPPAAASVHSPVRVESVPKKEVPLTIKEKMLNDLKNMWGIATSEEVIQENNDIVSIWKYITKKAEIAEWTKLSELDGKTTYQMVLKNQIESKHPDYPGKAVIKKEMKISFFKEMRKNSEVKIIQFIDQGLVQRFRDNSWLDVKLEEIEIANNNVVITVRKGFSYQITFTMEDALDFWSKVV